MREVFAGRVIVTPAPFDTAGEDLLLAWADAGGALLVYGPLDRAPRLRERLGLAAAAPLDGEFTVASGLTPIDTIGQTATSRYFHQNVMCGGPLTETPSAADAAPVIARNAAGEIRALHARAGTIDWLRGPLPMRLKGEHLPARDDPASTFPFASLVRHVLKQNGWLIALTAQTRTQRHPVVTLHRQTNGWFFSTYLPDTTVDLTLRTPFGAPLLLGMETWIRNGASTYRLPRALRLECRVFVEQADGWLKYIEELPGQVGVTRRSWVHGLCAATVRFFPPTGSGPTTCFLNPTWPYIAGETVPLREIATPHGPMLETTRPVTGTILLSW